jgi:glutathione S-transferase
MYTLIGTPKARPFRVLWMMEELGVEYDVLPISPLNKDDMAPFNPTGKVPALKDGEDIIIDSVAIMQYLADKHKQLTYPAGTIERAKQDSFTQFICDEIDGALWTAARNSFVNPEDRRAPAIKDVLMWEFERSINALETRLGDNEFLTGDTCTVPDLLLTHCCGWARNAGFPFESDPLRAYVKRMLARDGYKRADAIRSAA